MRKILKLGVDSVIQFTNPWFFLEKAVYTLGSWIYAQPTYRLDLTNFVSSSLFLL